MTFFDGSSGNVGIGTTAPSATLEIESEATSINSTSSVDANLIVQGTSSTRSESEGATIGFIVPANTDGSNHWQQGRILVTPDNTNNANASGRMYLQTRYYGSGAWRWRDNLVLKSSGNIGIGTANPDEKLTVKGKIHTEEVRVDLSVPGPDYVFEEDYNLASLEEIETFIQSEKHLPEVPSAAAMEANGVQLGEMNMLLLRKIEELTLHLIAESKENMLLRDKLDALADENSEFRMENEELKEGYIELLKRIEKLESK